MTPDIRDYLRQMTPNERLRLAAAARQALRGAWSHRHGSAQARYAIQENVLMLRALRIVGGSNDGKR